jgi:hypothetical protein
VLPVAPEPVVEVAVPFGEDPLCADCGLFGSVLFWFMSGLVPVAPGLPFALP